MSGDSNILAVLFWWLYHVTRGMNGGATGAPPWCGTVEEHERFSQVIRLLRIVAVFYCFRLRKSTLFQMLKITVWRAFLFCRSYIVVTTVFIFCSVCAPPRKAQC